LPCKHLTHFAVNSLCSETLAVESAWEKTNGMTQIEAGDKTWEVKLARVV
jgi:hypothetical protein